VLKFVMENPTDRVTYGDLKLVKSEFDELMELSLAAGTMKRHVPYEKYVDDSFVKAAKPTRIALA
jgi:NitT/TauT family transport system substrate-binding protein